MASTTSRKIFVNLAVADLDKSVEFFTKLGFTFDPRFTDENATCMIVSDEAFVMLLVESRFKDFTKKDLCDPRTHTEAIVAVSAENREQVDELADRAVEAGAAPANDPIDMVGFMYGRSFQDLDGHLWEVLWMDPSAHRDLGAHHRTVLVEAAGRWGGGSRPTGGTGRERLGRRRRALVGDGGEAGVLGRGAGDRREEDGDGQPSHDRAVRRAAPARSRACLPSSRRAAMPMKPWIWPS